MSYAGLSHPCGKVQDTWLVSDVLGAGVHRSSIAAAAGPVQVGVGTVLPVLLERGELDPDCAGERRCAGFGQVVVTAPGHQARERFVQIVLRQAERVHRRVAELELDEQCLLTVFENYAASVPVLL
jgi:hypothetical protein